MLTNQSKAKVCPKHLKSCSPKESSVSLQTFVHIWRYETKNNFLQIRVREDMQKNCQSSSWKFSFSTPRQDQKLWKCIAIVVGSWAFLLPSFSTTLRPLIISPNLQFNTFRPFSLPLQPDPNLCLSICTGRKKPASFIERERPSLAICLPSRKVCLAFPLCWKFSCISKWKCERFSNAKSWTMIFILIQVLRKTKETCPSHVRHLTC